MTQPSHHFIARKDVPNAPLAMTRSKLTALMHERGVSAQQVSLIAQALYERGFISYWHSEIGFLPGAHAPNVDATLVQVNELAPWMGVGALLEAPSKANPNAGVFVQDFVWAHHGIIPLVNAGADTRELSELHPYATQAYELIAAAYVAAVTAD